MKTQPENTGAAAALKWIADEVLESEKRLAKLKREAEKAVDAENNPPRSRDGEDFKAIRARCQQNYEDQLDLHLKLLTKLALFDGKVDPARRDASEAITRAEGEKVFSMIAIYMRTAAETFLTRSIPLIRESKTNEDAYNHCSEAFSESMVNAVKSAVGEAHLPSWAKNAVEGIL